MTDLEQDKKSAPEPEESDDDRRARAAEINRKRTEKLWDRNKKEWIGKNFPEKPGAGG